MRYKAGLMGPVAGSRARGRCAMNACHPGRSFDDLLVSTAYDPFAQRPSNGLDGIPNASIQPISPFLKPARPSYDMPIATWGKESEGKGSSRSSSSADLLPGGSSSRRGRAFGLPPLWLNLILLEWVGGPDHRRGQHGLLSLLCRTEVRHVWTRPSVVMSLVKQRRRV